MGSSPGFLLKIGWFRTLRNSPEIFTNNLVILKIHLQGRWQIGVLVSIRGDFFTNYSLYFLESHQTKELNFSHITRPCSAMSSPACQMLTWRPGGRMSPFLRAKFHRYCNVINLGEKVTVGWVAKGNDCWRNLQSFAELEQSSNVALHLADLSPYMWDETPRNDHWACAIIKQRASGLDGVTTAGFYSSISGDTRWTLAQWSRRFMHAPCCLPSLQSSHM